MSHLKLIKQISGCWFIPILALGISLLGEGTVLAVSQQAAFSVEVPANAWKAIKLKDLPKDMVVSVKVQSNGPLTVLVISEQEYPHFPKINRPLFVSPIENKVAFSLTTISAGHHFVVLDNREGTRGRSVALTVKAQQKKATQGKEARKRLQDVESQLKSFMKQVHQAIQFEPVPLKLGSCRASSTTFRRQAQLILCVEWAKALQEVLPNKGLATDTLVVSLFHELAHLMLQQWKQPLAEDEGMADELATTLMVVFRLDARVRAVMGHYRDHPEVVKELQTHFKNDPHLPSTERAREMLQWVNNPDQVAKWQSILIPNFQTALLKQLSNRPERWTDRAQVKAELAKRQLENPPQRNLSPSSKKELTF